MSCKGAGEIIPINVYKWVCMDANNYIVYVYATDWEQAEIKAKEKGLKLQGKFVSEHD